MCKSSPGISDSVVGKAIAVLVEGEVLGRAATAVMRGRMNRMFFISMEILYEKGGLRKERREMLVCCDNAANTDNDDAVDMNEDDILLIARMIL